MLVKAVALGVAAMIGLASVAAFHRAPAPTPQSVQAKPVAAAPAGMLPSRLFDCTLARIANFDPDKDMKPADYRMEGRFSLKLFLPAIPVRTTPPPQAPQPPEPVDPRTRVVADPQGIAGEGKLRFNRVVDLWPERVEMTAPISGAAVKLVVVTGKNDGQGADIFVANANDAVTYDRAHLYSGACTVAQQAVAAAAR
jgi:hypothetical protein